MTNMLNCQQLGPTPESGSPLVLHRHFTNWALANLFLNITPDTRIVAFAYPVIPFIWSGSV